MADRDKEKVQEMPENAAVESIIEENEEVIDDLESNENMKYQFNPNIQADPFEHKSQPREFKDEFLGLLTPDIRKQLDDGTFVAKTSGDLIVEKLYRKANSSNTILQILPAIPANKVVKKRNVRREPIISSNKYR